MEKKKIIGLVAGRHNGNSEILVKEALMACEEAGMDCRLINLFDYDIQPCTGCESCTMQMGDVARGILPEYKGCVLKDKDDMDKIINAIQTSDGLVIGVPTYDLAPSALYLKYAHRALAYEVSFRLEIGHLAKDPNLVAGLIAVGGSRHDWQTMALEVLGASMFTQSIQVVDQMMAVGNGRPGNVLLHDDQIAKAREIGQHVAFSGIPSFAPEHFAVIEQIDSMKRKQFAKGMNQIAQEGAIQIFFSPNGGMEKVTVGVVGVLQFDVLKFRMQSEYGVEYLRQDIPHELIRRVQNPNFNAADWNLAGDTRWVQDVRGNNLLIFNGQWTIQWAENKNPDLILTEFNQRL